MIRRRDTEARRSSPPCHNREGHQGLCRFRVRTKGTHHGPFNDSSSAPPTPAISCSTAFTDQPPWPSYFGGTREEEEEVEGGGVLGTHTPAADPVAQALRHSHMTGGCARRLRPSNRRRMQPNMATREFEELNLNGSNYPTWDSDIKITLAFRELSSTIQEPQAAVVVSDKKNILLWPCYITIFIKILKLNIL